jgi:hypothetical protein
MFIAQEPQTLAWAGAVSVCWNRRPGPWVRPRPYPRHVRIPARIAARFGINGDRS